MEYQIITCWYKYNKEKFEFQFNHISDGVDENKLKLFSKYETVNKD